MEQKTLRELFDEYIMNHDGSVIYIFNQTNMGTNSPIRNKKEFYYFRFSSILQSIMKADLRPAIHINNRPPMVQKYLDDGADVMENLDTYRSKNERSFSPPKRLMS